MYSTLKVDVMVNNIECRKILAQDGKSIGVALKYDIEKEISQGELRILELPDDIWIKIDAVVYRGVLVSPVLQEFISCIKTSFQE